MIEYREFLHIVGVGLRNWQEEHEDDRLDDMDLVAMAVDIRDAFESYAPGVIKGPDLPYEEHIKGEDFGRTKQANPD